MHNTARRAAAGRTSKATDAVLDPLYDVATPTDASRRGGAEPLFTLQVRPRIPRDSFLAPTPADGVRRSSVNTVRAAPKCS